jgi:hypothetical protein
MKIKAEIDVSKKLFRGSFVEATLVLEILRDRYVAVSFRIFLDERDPYLIMIHARKYDQALRYIKEFNRNILPGETGRKYT